MSRTPVSPQTRITRRPATTATADAGVLLPTVLEIYRATSRGDSLLDACQLLRAALDCAWVALVRLATVPTDDAVLALAHRAGQAPGPRLDRAFAHQLRASAPSGLARAPLAAGVPCFFEGRHGEWPYSAALLFADRANHYAFAMDGLEPDDPDPSARHETARCLLPHVAESLKLRAALDEGRARTVIDGEILDRLPYGFIVVDHDNTILLANAEGRRLLQLNDGLRQEGPRLVAASAALRIALDGALDELAGDREARQRSLQVERPSHRPPYTVSLVPVVITGTSSLAAPRRRLVVAITDPLAQPLPDERDLARAFVLTPAEARISRQLAAGREPIEIASELSVSLATVKTHLRHVYQKLEVRSRTALVQRLQSHCWTLAPMVIRLDEATAAPRTWPAADRYPPR